MNKVVLKPKRDYSLRRRHPWIFSGAVASEVGESGDLVEVVSAAGEALGFGWYSPASQIRVRMVSFGGDAAQAGDVTSLVAAAVGRRAEFFANAGTNAMRLVNAESDSLPGVVADYYAGWVVCQFTSAGAEKRKAEIAAALMTFAPFCQGVAVRNDVDVRVKEGLSTEPGFEVLAGGEPPELVEIAEGAAHFYVDVRKGHKTGFYLDQRDARAVVGPLGNNGDVLNCFSYTGGFGHCCRICGANNVTQVDVSRSALELAKKNEGLAHICDSNVEYVEADVFAYLRKCRDEGKKFDLIILDPPKFAETKAQLMKAYRGYKDINLLAMKLLKPNGTLATFSCSGAMTVETFDKMVQEASLDAGREFQIIARTRQGSDHPVALGFPEGLYLKGLILRSMS
ncbi:MAG: class I SAM-dependent rRNA methyltransferase [Kiritimatiellae bacterium]|nr:class I SAM-dependent rRNA methyltransferase [Kiritimatiellia bacterium]